MSNGIKSLWRLITMKLFLSNINSSMHFQIPSLRKWLGTPTTRKWFLCIMCSFVLLFIAIFWIWLGTLITRKWFLSSMSSSMLFQTVTFWKWLGTLITTDWVLPCFFISPAWENDFEYWSQGNGFCLMCVLLCYVNSHFL